MSTLKPSFYARFSTLIIVQIIFVFVALALIILKPAENGEGERSVNELRASLHATCDQVGEVLDGSIEEPLDQLSDTLLEQIKDVVRGNSAILAARICQIDNGRPLISMMLTRKDSTAWSILESCGTAECVHAHDYRIEPLDISHVEHAGTILSGAMLVETVILSSHEGCQTTMTTVAAHGMLISSRSNLIYYIWLLFLVSVLVSLLMIHLVNTRVKNPLTRLLRSISKTAKGDGYYIIEEKKDEELNSLITSFNELSRQLIENNDRLHSYSRQVTEMNIRLLQSHHFMATLIKSSPYPIVATGRSGKITMANDHALSALGYNEDGLAGRDLAELLIIPTDVDLNRFDRRLKAKGFEARCSKPDGSSFPVFIISSPIGLDGKSPEGWLYIIRDISESQSFQDMMIRLDRYYTRGEMAGDIAHDINNFIAILSGNLELMPMVIERNDQEKIVKKLSLMKETVDRIAMFANGLMDSPPEELKLEPSDLNQLLANVVEFIKPLKRLRGVELSLKLSDRLPLVPIDRAQVQQMMTNLIFNSAEALCQSDQARKIVVATEFVSNGDARSAIISVNDNGPGVQEQYLDRIFEKRFTTRRKGHGIGLITCRKIVEAHGGTISYRYNDGALFECYLPIHASDQSQAEIEVTDDSSILIG